IQPIGWLLKSKFPKIKIYQKNLYNAIQAAKNYLNKRIEFDASNLMRYLYSKRTEDLQWFVESRFDEPECRLSGLIWLSPNQQNLWTRYYDIIFLDTTSCTNKYNMNSFIWIFKIVNKYIGNLMPQVIYTDSNFAIASTIRSEYPSSVYCLCLFYIDLNLKKKLRNKLNPSELQEFRKDFFKYRNSMTKELFKNRWEALKLKFTSAKLVKEIQNILDKESNYMRMEEYKSEIPIVGLATEQDNTDYDEKMREDNYELMKVHLANIVEKEIIRKVLNLAIDTNSYDELIEICQNFILDKQQIQELQKDDEFNIENPRVTARKGRHP
ncbi:17737_t:CDS:2, partial [Gigaspora margarita]